MELSLKGLGALHTAGSLANFIYGAWLIELFNIMDNYFDFTSCHRGMMLWKPI